MGFPANMPEAGPSLIQREDPSGEAATQLVAAMTAEISARYRDLGIMDPVQSRHLTRP